MLRKPIFELLPIALIAISIVLIVILHTICVTITGVLIFIGACYLMYRRLMEMATEPNCWITVITD